MDIDIADETCYEGKSFRYLNITILPYKLIMKVWNFY